MTTNQRRLIRAGALLLVVAAMTYFMVHQIAVGICGELGGTFSYASGTCSNFSTAGGEQVPVAPWTSMVTAGAWAVAAVTSAVLTKIFYGMMVRAAVWYRSANRAGAGEP